MRKEIQKVKGLGNRGIFQTGTKNQALVATDQKAKFQDQVFPGHQNS